MDNSTLEDTPTISKIHFITAKPTGEECGELCDSAETDMDIGNTNDFEVTIAVSDYDTERMGYRCRIFAPGTEYGGIIGDIESISGTRKVALRGRTWRGMLEYKVVEPPAGQDHLTLSGELNTVIRTLIGDRFGGLFVVPETDTGITVNNWRVDRYVTLYDAMQKLVDNYGCRLQICYVQPEGLEYGYVTVRAAQIKDYSKDLEYSREDGIHVTDKKGNVLDDYSYVGVVYDVEGDEKPLCDNDSDTIIEGMYVNADGLICYEKPAESEIDDRPEIEILKDKADPDKCDTDVVECGDSTAMGDDGIISMR